MISITIPVFNEEEALPRLRERLVESLSKLTQSRQFVLVKAIQNSGHAMNRARFNHSARQRC